MIKHSIGIRDLHDGGTRALFNKVVDLFASQSLSSGLDSDALILEDFGTTLVQNAWTDDTGWYCVYRMRPSYNRSPRLQEADRQIPEMFGRIFGKDLDKVKVSIEDPSDPESRRTIMVAGGVYSIGD